jgi:hypothetical protein
MTTFKEIRGTAVQSLSSDPSNPEVGQIWYNNTIGVLKGYRSLGAVFSSGGNLSTARQMGGGAGTQTAALAFGGNLGGGPLDQTGATEEYNGTSWSGGGTMGTIRRNIASAGTQTAGLGATGYGTPPVNFPAAAEEYDGSTWTAGGSLATGRSGAGGAGTQTSALAFGGNPGPGPTNVTEEYDGSSWSPGGNLGTSRRYLMGCGTQTAGLAVGGFITTNSTATEEYDGSSWTAGGSLNTARTAGSAAGTQTSAIAIGPSAAESYNGTTWTTLPATMATSRDNLKGSQSGTATATVVFGGNTPAVSAATEEYTDPTFAVQKITTS